MNQATYIYALTDPVTEEVRYIGKTIHDPLDRLGCHVSDAQSDGRSHKNNWIKGLLLKGLEPDMSVLEIVFTPNDWQERERWWIAFAREQQYRLTNLTGGGEGHAGYSPTLETRAKISKSNKGKPKSKDIVKISARLLKQRGFVVLTIVKKHVIRKVYLVLVVNILRKLGVR